MTQNDESKTHEASDGETFVARSKNCIREIYRKFWPIIIAIHVVPTARSVGMHDEKFVGEKSGLGSNNKNVFNAGHVLTHYLRKLLGSLHFSC